jgi:hypothetical protein
MHMVRPMGLRSAADTLATDGDEMASPDVVDELHHRQNLWIPWTVVLLGIWLLTAPFTFGYLNDANWAVPSGGRGVWFSDDTHDQLRAQLMTWSNVVSGLALVVLGWRMLRRGRPVAWWAACFVGIWLVFAPILLWSPTAAGFYNDSIVGLTLIALTILIPGMPAMATYMQMGPPQPPGWTYNPSSWSQRSILIALGFAGLLVSRYLAAYQLGYIESVWDPFFGFAQGTQPVLDSDMSHMWPISDAGLGAVAYSFEFLMGYMGGPSRWRTMPWMVTIFGILVIPLGLAHITLVMSQPVLVHEWCTMCLLAAGLMLPMIPLEIDEVVAMFQHVRDAKRRGDRGGSLWQIFWKGGSGDDSQPDDRSPDIAEVPERPIAVARASVWGFSVPPTLAVAAVLGLALLAAPDFFDQAITSGAADIAHLGGAAVLVIAVISMGEVVRSLRWLALPVGVVMAAAVWVVDTSAAYAVFVTIAALAVAVLAVPRGRVIERYADWDRFIR